jgi:glycerophosphoryl diester phosphodiesterase
MMRIWQMTFQIPRRIFLAFLGSIGAFRAADARGTATASSVVSHRGQFSFGNAQGRVPENTMAAFRSAAASGVKFLETDCQVSADGYAMLIHDKTVARTTGAAGQVGELTLAELRALDASLGADVRFKGEKIPTLEEFFRFCRERGLTAVPEIKDYRTASDIQIMMDVMKRSIKPESVIWCSARLNDLVAVRKRYKVDQCGLGLIGHSIKNLQAFADLGGKRAVLLNWRKIIENPDWVQSCHAAGVEVWPWTVNRLADAERLLEMGCDKIISDGFR